MLRKKKTREKETHVLKTFPEETPFFLVWVSFDASLASDWLLRILLKFCLVLVVWIRREKEGRFSSLFKCFFLFHYFYLKN